MGEVKDDYTLLTDANPPRYRYYPDEDELYLLINADLVKSHGLVIDQPEALPYYVEMEDRLGRIGHWLYWPEIKMNYAYNCKVIFI